MTYNDIKLATLQKMFHDVTNTTPTLVTKPYLEKMAYVCNCAIQKITAAGFGERKFYEIIRTVPHNILGQSGEHYKLNRITEGRKYTASRGKSYFFEICGAGTVKIFAGDTLIKTIENSETDTFKKYKGTISNDYNRPITVMFCGGNAYLVKNIAVYDEEYASDSEVYEISEMVVYDMSELVEDFYKFDSETDVVADSGNSYGFLGEKCLCVNGLKSGVWKIPYIAYPQIITQNTSDDEEIKLPLSVCGIIPYYIASELYLEDDSGLCVGWRNKFEEELRTFSLSRRNRPYTKMKFVSLAGDLFGEL